MIKLGVNIDHAATLRQVRGGTTNYPDMLNILRLVQQGGADQVTLHLREDRRHIQEKDLATIVKQAKVAINLEMAATWEMVKIAKKYRPTWCCFVPEKREELTTEGGLNVKKNINKISHMVKHLNQSKILCSMFIEPSIQQVEASLAVGADAVEFHTGHYVLQTSKKKNKEWKRLCAAAEFAHKNGLRVHAGHGLDFKSIKQIKKLPYLLEVNIGHSLICYSLEWGLKKSVKMMKAYLR